MQQPINSREHTAAEVKAIGHTASPVRKEEGTSVHAQPRSLSLFYSGSQPIEWCHPHAGWVFPLLINPDIPSHTCQEVCLQGESKANANRSSKERCVESLSFSTASSPWPASSQWQHEGLATVDQHGTAKTNHSHEPLGHVPKDWLHIGQPTLTVACPSIQFCLQTIPHPAVNSFWTLYILNSKLQLS